MVYRSTVGREGFDKLRPALCILLYTENVLYPLGDLPSVATSNLDACFSGGPGILPVCFVSFTGGLEPAATTLLYSHPVSRLHKTDLKNAT